MPGYISSEAKEFFKKVLEKDPEKRPSTTEIKEDPFFALIDWGKLERKEMSIPVILRKPIKTDEVAQFFKKPTYHIDDEDYTEVNEMVNRVFGYSFIRSIK